MSDTRYEADEVFGIVRGLPPNYVARENVDDRLRDYLDRGQHVVVYGSSKQGKTCLRKHCIPDDDQIVVQCSNQWDVADVHAAILKRAGYEVTLSEKRTVSGTRKIRARVSAAILGLGASTTGEEASRTARETETRELELDPEDVNDVIRALDEIGFDRYVVLEDFHYLPQDTQQDFAVALKAFHEASSLKFVVVGVWLEENRLIVHNGDLTGRVVSLNADDWSTDQLLRIIENGEELLGVRFDDAFKRDLVTHSYESVYVVQEACREALRREGIRDSEPDGERVGLGRELDAKALVRHVVGNQSARYESFLRNFAAGFGETELELHRWLLYPVLTTDTADLEDGIAYRDVRAQIERHHPVGDDLNPGNLTRSLQSVGSLQSEINVKPFVLDYDGTAKRLSVVDRGFLIWLDNQDRDELLEHTGLTPYLE